MTYGNYRKNDKYSLCVVLGQSMKPFFHSGDVVCLAKIDWSKLVIGNVICFKRKSDKASVIHRIVGIAENSGGRKLITQGDNLSKSDGYIYADQIEGVVTGRYRKSNVKPISRLEDLTALKLSPLLRLMRGFIRKFLAVCINILYPYMHIKKVAMARVGSEELSMLWCGKKVATLRTSDGDIWVHPWFRNTPVIKRLG